MTKGWPGGPCTQHPPRATGPLSVPSKHTHTPTHTPTPAPSLGRLPLSCHQPDPLRWPCRTSSRHASLVSLTLTPWGGTGCRQHPSSPCMPCQPVRGLAQLGVRMWVRSPPTANPCLRLVRGLQWVPHPQNRGIQCGHCSLFLLGLKPPCWVLREDIGRRVHSVRVEP